MLLHVRNSIILLFLLLGCLMPLFAQSFIAPGGRISDYSGPLIVDSFPIQVNGLSGHLGDGFGLGKVCITIIHPRVSDIKVELQSPDGSTIWLTNRNGGAEARDYYQACFRMNGFSGYIHQANPPFVNGEYIPDGRMSFLNNGQNPNGTWWLRIRDLREGETGTLNSFTLHFEEGDYSDEKQRPCNENYPEACQCPGLTDSCDLLPDFIILESFTRSQIKEYPFDHPYYGGQLRFAATIANVGDGPMETRGSDRWYCGEDEVVRNSLCADGEYARQELTQRIYHLADGELSWEDRSAGFNYYDDKPGHDHFHVDDWVEFRLVKEEDGNLKNTLIAEGRKVSYCLFDTGICNNLDSLCTWQAQVFGEKNLPNYGFGHYASCNAEQQGISVGGYDTYGMLYEGQFLQLPEDLPSGEYWLEIEIDPLQLFYEKDRSNNLFRMPVLIQYQEK